MEHEITPPETFEQAFDTITEFARRLMVMRQEKYGPQNVDKGGEIGIVTRISDKVERLRTAYGLPDNPHPPTDAFGDESLDDTLFDLMNHAAIALIRRRGWWGLPLQKDTIGAQLTNFYDKR